MYFFPITFSLYQKRKTCSPVRKIFLPSQGGKIPLNITHGALNIVLGENIYKERNGGNRR